MGEVDYDFLGEQSSVSAARRGFDGASVRAIEWLVAGIARHWLFVLNAVVGAFAGLPVVAPILAAIGANGPANAIYLFYSFSCHQMPSRSWFILGHKMAYCERDTAIYTTMFLAGLVFARYRARLKPLRFVWYLVLILPMAVDGFTQLFGWRESTWLLRTITGTLFGAATVWLTYPYLERAVKDTEVTDDLPGPNERAG